MKTGGRVFLAVVAPFAVAQTAFAQRTDDNAVTQSEDAFGKSVGDQSIGIYNAGDVRGFSPTDAGNVRLEGLYFDPQANFTDRLIDSSRIRIGISAQGYPFPAPTGIVDYTLQKPGDKFLASVGATFGPWKGRKAELDIQLPIDGDRLGVAAGVDYVRDGTAYGTVGSSISTALVLRYAPAPDVEILSFWGRTRDRDQEAQPLIFTAGAFLPKRFPRNEFTGQDWADYSGRQSNYGVIARAKPLGFDVRLGVFRSTYTIDEQVFDLLFGTTQDGAVARRFAVIENGDTGRSTSGELRVERSITEGPRRHAFIASVRARQQDRSYGGESIVGPRASRSDVADPRPRPVTVDGPKTRDRVTQTTFGLAYEGKWLNVGELTVGVQKARYKKDIIDPDPTVVFPVTRDSPWLVTAAAAVYATPRIAFYAGYTRGLEESPVAPGNAVNLNEAPPAIRTRQADGGVRWTISKGVNVIAGVFEVAKPYFNLDGARVFRQLGDERRRGIELSVAGVIAPNLFLLAGNTFIDATVSGAGTLGNRPIGSAKRRTQVSLNYRVAWHKPLSFDAVFDSASKRVANAANTLYIPARAGINIGARYRFKIDDKPVLIRAQVGNVTNTFGWSVGSTGYFLPNASRRFLLSISADI